MKILLTLFVLFFSSSLFAGCINGDCIGGFGVYEWDNGSKYVGKYKDGSDIDYSWQGMEDIFHPDTVSFYECIIRPKRKKTFELDFM